MARTKDSNIITLWLESQSESDRKAFLDYCRAHYRCKPMILAYLTERNCQVRSLSTVYKWVGANITAGDQAALFNRNNAEFVGLEIQPVLEKLLARLSTISQKFYDVIDKEEALSPDQVINSLPAYAREMRSVAEQISKIENKADYEALVLSGAIRVLEICMGNPSVKDQPGIEEHFRKVLENAALQVKEELGK